MKALHIIAFILVIIGGLNWGLVAIGNYMSSNWDVVALVFGSISTLQNAVYLLVGLSALVLIFSHKKDCRACEKPSMPGATGMGM